MGYRSDVAICIYGPKDKMIALVAAARIQGCMPVNAFSGYTNVPGSFTLEGRAGLHMFDYDDNKRMIHAYYEEVKWYDGYEDVDTWTEFLRKAAAAELSTEFIRIGENYEDIDAEQYGECQYYLGVHRSMQIDIPEETSVNT